MSRPVDLLRSTHPGPTVAVTALATVLTIGARADAGSVALVAGAVLANQLSIGLANDVLDADRDRTAGRTDKPIADGRLARRPVMAIAVGLAVLSLALTLLISPVALAAGAVLLVGGWAYDLVLKHTPLSPVPYLLGFGALPWLAAAAAREPHLPAWWAVTAAALLGGAAHVANVLPDLAEDRRAGIRGLPQLLGRAGSVIACLVLLAATASVLWAGLGGWSGFALAVAGLSLTAAAGVLAARGGGRGVFRLVIAAALVDAIALAFTGPGSA